MKKNDLFLLTISLFFFFFLYPFCYKYPLHPFIPFLVFGSFYLPFSHILWCSLGFGIMMDITSSITWGLTPFAYSAASFILFRKIRIREHTHAGFLLLTIVYTFLVELIRSIIYIEQIFSLNWMRHIFFLSPISMTFYSLLIVSLPLLVWKKIGRWVIISRKRLLQR